MPAPMTRGGGGGKYGIAAVRLSKNEVLLQDLETEDRFAFPLVEYPKSNSVAVARLLRKRQAGLVANPTREGKEARTPVVYPGEFAYSMSSKADVLYGISPASDSHLCHYVGWARPGNDPKATPTWEARRSAFDSSKTNQEFAALFITSDGDEFPGLEVRWNYWRYKYVNTTNEDGEPIMGVDLLDSRSGGALKAQYELLRLAGIIGKDPATNLNMVLMDIPGSVENWLPAVESILRKRLASMEFVLAFETYEGEDGKSRVRINSLSKQPGAAGKRAVAELPDEDYTDEDGTPAPKKKAAAKAAKPPLRRKGKATEDDAQNPF